MRLVLPFSSPMPAPQACSMRLPLLSSKVCCGFPSPADDHLEGYIDLNKRLIKNSASTFFVRVEGDSMRGANANILPGDMLVVDRSITEPRDNQIVVACIDGEFNCKRFRKKNGKAWLESDNEDYATIEIGPEQDVIIWGVVISRISEF